MKSPRLRDLVLGRVLDLVVISVEGMRDRLLATARIYLASLKHDMPCRFDAVLINGAGDIEWIRNAFGA